MSAMSHPSVRSGSRLALFFHILGFALFIFWLLLIARVVVEFIRSFSRDWHPTGITVVILEIILSIMVLLLVAFIGMQVALNVRG